MNEARSLGRLCKFFRDIPWGTNTAGTRWFGNLYPICGGTEYGADGCLAALVPADRRHNHYPRPQRPPRWGRFLALGISGLGLLKCAAFEDGLFVDVLQQWIGENCVTRIEA